MKRSSYKRKTVYSLVDLAELCLPDKNEFRNPEQRRYMHILELWQDGTFVEMGRTK